MEPLYSDSTSDLLAVFDDALVVGFFVAAGVVSFIWFLRVSFSVCSYRRKPKVAKIQDAIFGPHDVTVIAPITRCDAPSIVSAVSSWLASDPFEVILVTTYSMLDHVSDSIRLIDNNEKVRLVSVPLANTRLQIIVGAKTAQTPLIAIASERSVWPENLSNSLLDLFSMSSKLGAVVCAHRGPSTSSLFPSVWHVLETMRLDLSNQQNNMARMIDGGMIELSKHTMFIRRIILSTDEFTCEFGNEEWMKGSLMDTSENLFINRWLARTGWTVSFVYQPNCFVEIKETSGSILPHYAHKLRDQHRSDCLSIFKEGNIWLSRYPFVFLFFLQRLLHPLIFFSEHVFLGYALWTSNDLLLKCFLTWLVVSRIANNVFYFARRPWHLVYLPFVFCFELLHVVIHVAASYFAVFKAFENRRVASRKMKNEEFFASGIQDSSALHEGIKHFSISKVSGSFDIEDTIALELEAVMRGKDIEPSNQSVNYFHGFGKGQIAYRIAPRKPMNINFPPSEMPVLEIEPNDGFGKGQRADHRITLVDVPISAPVPSMKSGISIRQSIVTNLEGL